MKKYLLSLFVSMLAVSGAWAQDCEWSSSDAVGDPVRRLEVVLSGDWLNGDEVEAMTTALIDLIMGYDATTETFDADQAYTEVTIKSAEGTTVTVNQALVQQLITGKARPEGSLSSDYPNGYALEKNHIVHLDLSDVAVTHYVGHESSSTSNGNATLFARNGGVSPVKYFAMPSFDTTVEGQTYTVPSYTTAYLEAMDELILPKNAKILEPAAFANGNFNKFKLNPGLEFIGNSAFYASSDRVGMETLDIPSSVKYIGPDAFFFRIYTDIFFHSPQAPICPVGKGLISGNENAMLYQDCYFGNGGFTDKRDNAEKMTPTKLGYANRENYYSNGNRWFVMVHFPSSAEMEEIGETLDIPSYKDDTRVYRKVYGTIYYDASNDAGKLEIAEVGKEQEYIERGKIWAEQGSYDYVGKETSTLSYGSVSANKEVDSGFEDTFRGLNYIWPSQTQYNRAYVTVANGVNWDGVTKYRPEISEAQLALMIKDGLQLKKADGNYVTVGATVTYDDAMANAYNAKLEGAVHEGEAKDWYTADEALEYNANLEGAKQAGDKYSYTDAEAYAYNANLEGAVKEGDVKEAWTEETANAHNANLPGAVHEGDNIYYTADEVLAYNAGLTGAVKEGDPYDAVETVYYTWEEFKAKYPDFISENGWMTENDYWTQYVTNPGWHGGKVIKTQGKPAGNYTAAEAAEYNEGLEGAIHTTTIHYENITAAQANAYNATLSGAVKAGDAISYYSADDAKAYNQTLPGAVNPGDYVTFTEETAAAFNAALPGAVKEGDVKETWTAADAIANNAALPGAREAGYSENNTVNPEISDLISMQAYQSTRRCVFAANDGGGDDYNTHVPASKAWWTICLPFDMTKDQIDEYFGKGTHVCLFNKVDREVKQLPAKSTLKFYFTDDQYPKAAKGNDVVLQAHVPYMIFPTLDGANGVEDEVVKIHMSNFYKKTGNPVGTDVVASDGQKYRFIGNYDTKLPVMDADGNVTTTDVVVPQYSYIYAKKAGATGKHPYQFWFTQNAGIKWAPNKCIIESTDRDRGLTDQTTFFDTFDADDYPEQSNVKQMTILLGDDDANDIEVVFIAGDGENSEVIYNLNGQMLNSVPQNGIYIKNGKKYIAK